MTRIGVMTFLHNDNYGSILQAWALQRTLAGLGFEAEHIDYAPSRAEKLRNLILSGNSPGLVLEGVRKRSATGKMNGGFCEFRQEQLALSACCADRAALRRTAAQYDVLVCGSDQIWSPVWLNPAYFLDFTERPKVAYAPSLGVKELPEKRKQRRIARLVRSFGSVSVREAEGAALLRTMAGIDAPVLPDPVMLMPQEAWRGLKSDDAPTDPYVLCYFIGDAPRYWEAAKAAGQALGAPVRVIPRTEAARQSGFMLEEDVPPQKWLALIAGAARLVTDSFHGAAFAAILNVPCTIVRRYREDDPESKNSRIDQLLRSLGTERLEADAWPQVNEAIVRLAVEGKKWLLDAISQAAQ